MGAKYQHGPAYFSAGRKPYCLSESELSNKFLILLLFSVVSAPAQLLEDWIRQIVGTNLVTTNATLINSSFSGLFRSTNAYSVTYGVGDASGHGGQIWHQTYTGDTNAAPFSFRTGVVSNNFNPVVNNSSPFSAVNDVQLHYGYNLPGTVGYNPELLAWVRGFESCWFNPYRLPRVEIYDRVGMSWLRPGFWNVGFGYELSLEDGLVEAAIDAHSLSFRAPGLEGQPWMVFSANTNNEGVINILKGYIRFDGNTNEWMLRNVIGNQGSNYLFTSGGGIGPYNTITLLKGANTYGSVLGLQVGSANPKGIRWEGVTNHQWEYQQNNGAWRPMNDGVVNGTNLLTLIKDLQARITALEQQ